MLYRISDTIGLVIARIKRKLYLFVASYFRFFANFSFRRWRPRVIAVTGSVGKTTMLNILEVQLGKRAHYSHNANSAYGVAFDVLGMDGVRGSKFKWVYLFLVAPIRGVFFSHQQEFYVVEIDGERPKETEFLAEWLKPEVTLWVSVGRSHAVYFDEQVRQGLFDSVEQAIVHEFLYLPKNTSKLVAYNQDNLLISRVMAGIEGIEKVGVSNHVLSEYHVWPDKTELVIGGVKYIFGQPQPREIVVQLGLLKVLADYLGEAAVEDLSSFVQPPGRGNYFPGKRGTKLIDSSFNAHLISLKSTVELFEQMEASPKWIVVGDIIEQGEGEAEEHRRLARILRKANFDRYILVGRRTQKHTYPEMDASKTVTFLGPKDVAIYLEAELQGGETVLFKGSQYLEGVVERLLENPHDVSKLPRQEPAAKKRRTKWGLA